MYSLTNIFIEYKYLITKLIKPLVIADELSFSNKKKKLFESEIQKHKSYLEYGSGSSTIYVSKQNYQKVYSVESDYYYAKYLKAKKLNNVTILKPKIGITGIWGYPIFFRHSFKKGYRYVNIPWEYSDSKSMFDVVLIDGRYRVACVLNIISMCSNNHDIVIIFDDYIGRNEYKIVEKYLKLINFEEDMAIFEYKKTQFGKYNLTKLRDDFNTYLSDPR